MYVSTENITKDDWVQMAAIISVHRRRIVTPEEFMNEHPRDTVHKYEYYLCREGNQVFGFARVHPDADDGVYVNGLFTRADRRQTGVATRIGLTILARYGHQRMRLHVDSHLDWLVQAYSKAGFVMQNKIDFDDTPHVRTMIRPKP